MLADQQTIILNSTSSPNPNPVHTDPSQYPSPFETEISSSLHHAAGATSEATNNVVVTPKPPKEIRRVRCDVCNITCNNEDLLEKHKQGRKHLKSLQNPAGSSVSAPTMVPPPPVASETLVGELEKKKPGILQPGAKADSIHCDLCNVVCYSQEIYQKHVVGKKHSAKAIIQLASMNGYFAATSNSSGGSQKKPNTFQCGLCKITCTSNELLSMHIAGKKHLNKLRESGQIPNLPSTTVASPMVNLESEGNNVNSDGSNMNGKRAGSHVDVESKKQKILQGGAPLNAIRTCTLCNVVCNSPTVFNAHLAGQKHAAMVLQLAETLTTGQEH
ncbi:hypothetical protein M8C21_026493 [Ambrosia artemisiifolia]|uniref:Uncharacterized protein n=1 Tax=Ambrosia artemisiifolia TaxID=4212 RepID=A0AAD5GH82_AMBAR|nr:hypothetical protein M8C21_026493 [Ambrosia artemisiifolia]